MMHQSSANLVILSKSSSSNLIESLFSKTVNREVSSANSLILQFISLFWLMSLYGYWLRIL